MIVGGHCWTLREKCRSIARVCPWEHPAPAAPRQPMPPPSPPSRRPSCPRRSRRSRRVRDRRRDGRPVAAIELCADAPIISAVEHLVGSRREQPRPARRCRRARPGPCGLRELRWPGFRGGRRRWSATARCRRAGDHLDNLGVPLWRDGTASLSQSLYYPRRLGCPRPADRPRQHRRVAVFSGGELTLAHIVVPALLCAVARLFAIWQIGLLAVAARRSRRALGVRRNGGGRRRGHRRDRRTGLRPRRARARRRCGTSTPATSR